MRIPADLDPRRKGSGIQPPFTPPATNLSHRCEQASADQQRKGPAVIVGPYGHCLAPGHEGHVVATLNGYALTAAALRSRNDGA